MSLITLLIVSFVVLVGFGTLSLWFNHVSGTRYPGQIHWILGFCMLMVSLSFQFLNKYDSLFVNVFVSHTLNFFGYYFILIGTLRFYGKEFRDHIPIAIFCAFHLILIGSLTYGENYINPRLAILSFMAAIFSFAVTMTIHLFNRQQYKSAKLAMIGSCFHGGFCLFIAGAAIMDDARTSFLAKTFIAQITLYEYIAIALLMLFSFNMMIRERKEKESFNELLDFVDASTETNR